MIFRPLAHYRNILPFHRDCDLRQLLSPQVVRRVRFEYAETVNDCLKCDGITAPAPPAVAGASNKRF